MRRKVTFDEMDEKKSDLNEKNYGFDEIDEKKKRAKTLRIFMITIACYFDSYLLPIKQIPPSIIKKLISELNDLKQCYKKVIKTT